MIQELVELNGILLRTFQCKDQAYLMEVLTAERGKVFIYTKQASKTNKNTMYSWTFAYSKFEVSVGFKGLLVYRGSTVQDYFPELRKDPIVMTIGQYFCEISSCVPEHIENPQDYLKVLLNSLYVLSGRTSKPIDPKIIKLVFEISYLQLSGFMPNAESCSECHNDPVYWHFDEGFLCEQCAQKYPEHELHRINETIIHCINHILSSNGVKKFAFNISELSFIMLQRLTEEYLQYKFETKFKTLQVYKGLVVDQNTI